MTATTIHVAYDDVSIGLIPPNPFAVAVYVDGSFANETAARAAFPHALLVPITVTGRANVRFCDCETGDLTVSQAASWARGEHDAGRKPGIYTSVSNVPALLQALFAVGLHRGDFVLWTAHYTGVAHLCSPTTCGYPGLTVTADGTQFTDHADGRSLDESLVTDAWLGIKPAPPHVVAPHGTAHILLSLELGSGHWSHHHIPGTASWGSEDRFASIELQYGIGGKVGGVTRLRTLPWNAAPLGGP